MLPSLVKTMPSVKKIFILLIFPFSAFASEQHHSHYKGQEKRAIKSLSVQDIQEIEQGHGWGLAKIAELNGVPGPKHLLEMKNEINLSSGQTAKIESIFAAMQAQAIEEGRRYIAAEKALNDAFAQNNIDEQRLLSMLANIEQSRKKLRYIHLSSHLEAADILSQEQITSYNRLRGYDSDSPCDNIPQGHNPEMWKKHHDC